MNKTDTGLLLVTGAVIVTEEIQRLTPHAELTKATIIAKVIAENDPDGLCVPQEENHDA